MKKNKHIASMDIALVSLLGLFLAVFVLLSFQMQHALELSLLFCAEVVILLLVYFKGSLILGLSLTGAAVLCYGAYTLYYCLKAGEPPPTRLYFFALWMPLVTLAFWRFIHQSHILAVSNGKMQEALDTLSTIDDETGMNNLRAYVSAMPAYMNRSRRYGLGLGLIMVRVRYQDEGCEVAPVDLKRAAQMFEDTIRLEDDVFLISSEPYLLALVLLMQKNEDGEIVLQRLQQAEAPPSLCFDFGCFMYDSTKEDAITAQVFLDEALAAMTPNGQEEKEDSYATKQ